MLNNFKENDKKSSIDNLLQNKDEYKILAQTAYKNIKIILKMLLNIQIINMILIYQQNYKTFFIIQILKKLQYQILVLILHLTIYLMI